MSPVTPPLSSQCRIHNYLPMHYTMNATSWGLGQSLAPFTSVYTYVLQCGLHGHVHYSQLKHNTCHISSSCWCSVVPRRRQDSLGQQFCCLVAAENSKEQVRQCVMQGMEEKGREWGGARARCIGRMSEAPEALPSSNHCEGGANGALALRRPSLLALTTVFADAGECRVVETTHQLTSKVQFPVSNRIRELRGLVHQIYCNPWHVAPISSQLERCTRYGTQMSDPAFY